MPAASSDKAELIGRADEYASLLGLLDRAREGYGGIGIVRGEAGIGKTHLLERVVAASDVAAHIGHCEELRRDRPFAPLIEALDLHPQAGDRERVEIAGMLVSPETQGDASLITGGPPHLQYEVVERMIGLVERLASAAPLALVIEDIHWADSATLHSAYELADAIRRLPAALLLTLRPVPRTAELEGLLAALLEDRGGAEIELRALSNSDVRAILEESCGATPGPTLLSLAEGTGGNPLLLTELVRSLQRDGRLRIDEGQAEVEGGSPPLSFRETIVHQLRYLPDSAVDVLLFASILGSSFSVDDLSVALARPTSELVPPLRQCTRAGLLAEEGGRLVFRHELVRQAVYMDVSAPIRSSLHLQVGRALAKAGAPAGQVTTHLSLGAVPGDRDAVEWLWRAGREAASQAPVSAVTLLERSIALAPPGFPRRDAILADLVGALVWANRLADATDRAAQLLGGPHDSELGRAVRIGLARAQYFTGHVRDSLEGFRSLITEPGLDPIDQIRLSAEASFVALFTGDLAGAIESADEAVAEADRHKDGLAASIALMTAGFGRFLRGDLAEAMELGARSVNQADRSGPEAQQFLQRLFFGTTLFSADRFEEGKRVLREGLDLARDRPWQVGAFLTQLGWLEFFAGELDDSLATLVAAVPLVKFVAGFDAPTRAMISAIATRRGDLEKAEDTLATAERDAQAMGSEVGLDAPMWAKAILLEAKGDVAGAHAILQLLGNLYIAAGIAQECSRVAGDIVRVAVAADDRDSARPVVQLVEGLAERAPTPTHAAVALRCRAVLEDDPDLAQSAADAYKRSPQRIEAALATEEAAGVLARAGRVEAAARLLDEAIEVFAEQGLTPAAARAESSSRALGIRRGRRGPRGRPAKGWESLTPTELEVVRFVTQGLSTPEIARRLYVSRRTIETHLSHVFGKLDVSSRAQLAAEGTKRSLQRGWARPS